MTESVLGILVEKPLTPSLGVQHDDSEAHAILTKHFKLFSGTGHLKNTQVKLEIDETVPPVCSTLTENPSQSESVKAKVNAKLEEMRAEGIIEKVQGATPWLPPLVAIPKKNGDVQLVLDMRMANTVLTRRRVQTHGKRDPPTDGRRATIFSKVDLSQGYLQLTFAELSPYITAFRLRPTKAHTVSLAL